MRNRLTVGIAGLFLLLPLNASFSRMAVPGYRYEFPRDNYDHPDFQTEWWYYTGNVETKEGHEFGFELAFFRRAVDRDPKKTETWGVRDLYLAHLALTDLSRHQFFYTERTNRSGPGLAGISRAQGKIWNGNWGITWQGDTQELTGLNDKFQLHLTLKSLKPSVINGENGVSQKGDARGQASHYISLTRLEAKGQIQVAGQPLEVGGTAWMDHEFFTQQLESNQVGWDWLSLQLDDGTELMLFNIRRKDGSIDAHSAGTYVDAEGRSQHLGFEEFEFRPDKKTWTSPRTHGAYPVIWNLSIPKLALKLAIKTPLESQELSGASRFLPNYWEGAIRALGTRSRTSLGGKGYLEMTGYDRAIVMDEKSEPAVHSKK